MARTRARGSLCTMSAQTVRARSEGKPVRRTTSSDMSRGSLEQPGSERSGERGRQDLGYGTQRIPSFVVSHRPKPTALHEYARGRPAAQYLMPASSHFALSPGSHAAPGAG